MYMYIASVHVISILIHLMCSQSVPLKKGCDFTLPTCCPIRSGTSHNNLRRDTNETFAMLYIIAGERREGGTEGGREGGREGRREGRRKEGREGGREGGTEREREGGREGGREEGREGRREEGREGGRDGEREGGGRNRRDRREGRRAGGREGGGRDRGWEGGKNTGGDFRVSLFNEAFCLVGGGR